MFKLAPFGNGQVFDLTTPDLRVPGIPDDALQPIISQASHLAQARTPFRRLAGRGPSFRGFLFCGLCNLRSLQDSAPRCKEDSQYGCGRSHDTSSCLFFAALCIGHSQCILTQVLQNQRCQLDMLQDVPDQVRYMHTSAHVHQVAGGST